MDGQVRLLLELIRKPVLGFLLRPELEFVLRLVFDLELHLTLGLNLEPQELQVSLRQKTQLLHLFHIPRDQPECQVKQDGLEPDWEHLPNYPVVQLPVPRKRAHIVIH